MLKADPTSVKAVREQMTSLRALGRNAERRRWASHWPPTPSAKIEVAEEDASAGQHLCLCVERHGAL
jgi:hypothetical protein